MDSPVYWIFLLIVPHATAVEDQTEKVRVKTLSGDLTGLNRTYLETGDTVFEFRGIPYATPPVGNLRFRKPKPFGKWPGTLDATSFGSACPQTGINVVPNATKPMMSEDCLFLNVYVPKVLSSGKTFSVMVYIHGGGFVIGSSHQHNGERIAVEGNVIVVTLNYRLNIFGFLALNHPASLGNYGLWDQILALQWVNDNIESFGGNPDSVTIFGESAGGWSTSYHSLIPSNDGLFQRVIAQSGVVARTSMARTKSIDNNIELISRTTNCNTDDLEIFVDCLREKSVEELLISITQSFFSYDKLLYDLVYQPVIDGDLFKEHPIGRLENKQSSEAKFFASLDFLTGTTSHEGSILNLLIAATSQSKFNFKVSEKIPFEFLCEQLIQPYVLTFYKNNAKVTEKMCKFYSSEESTEKQSMNAIDFYTDSIFLYPATKMLQYHSSLGGKSYQYLFSKISPRPLVTPPSWFKGCGHADELLYLFDFDTMFNRGDVQFSKEEKELSQNVIKYWTSFAKTGNPNADDSLVKWEQYDDTTRSYLNFDDKITAETNLKKDTIEFWSEQLPAADIKDEISLDHDEL